MKKLLCILFATAILLSCFLFSTSASIATGFILDNAEAITDSSEEKLETKAAKLLNDTGISFYLILLEDPSVTSTSDYIDNFLGSGVMENTVVICENLATNKYFIDCTSGLFTEDELDTIVDEAYNSDDSDTYAIAADLVLDKIRSMADEKYGGSVSGNSDTPVILYATDSDNEPFELPIPAVRGPEGIPDSRLQPRLVDAAGIIPDNQEAEILALLDHMSETDEFDYVVATTASCAGSTPEEVADDYYDYNGFGFGENRDGCLLLISMDPRYVHISTTGKGMNIITNDEIDSVIDKFYDAVKAGDFATASIQFVNAAHSEYNKFKARPVLLALICIGIGFLVSKISISSMKKSYNTVRKDPKADNYIVPGTLSISQSHDLFLYSNISKTAIPKSTSSSGGGGSHTSSSGTSHGGGGRSF